MGTCHIKLSNRSRCQQYISHITEHLIRCEVKQLCTCMCVCVLGLLTSDSPPPTIRLDKSGYRSPIRLASCLLKLSLSFLIPHPRG